MEKKGVQFPPAYKYFAAFLTMRCNLKCSFCLNILNRDNFNRKKFVEISGKEWVKGLNRVESLPEVPITFCGGEPFLHRDFFYILNNLKQELNIDILTNLHWGKKGIKRFVREVNPKRLKRDSSYPSIRASYHPEQMGNGYQLLENTRILQDNGFSIGIYAVQFPSPKTLEAITRMQFFCLKKGVDFRIKDFTGRYAETDDSGRPFSLTYGDYSKYPKSAFQETTKNCYCKTSELLLGPDGNAYRCHRDLYEEECPMGNLLDLNFTIEDKFRPCKNYGKCHPCDVKVKTNYKQQTGHTSVEIIDLE